MATCCSLLSPPNPRISAWISGLHAKCVKIMSAKRLGDDQEPSLLQWLSAGKNFPNKEDASKHLAELLAWHNDISIHNLCDSAIRVIEKEKMMDGIDCIDWLEKMIECQNIRTYKLIFFTGVYSLSIIFIYWVMTAALRFALSILLPSGCGRLFNTDWRQIGWMTIDAGPRSQAEIWEVKCKVSPSVSQFPIMSSYAFTSGTITHANLHDANVGFLSDGLESHYAHRMCRKIMTMWGNE